jgi:hypothetical protein
MSESLAVDFFYGDQIDKSQATDKQVISIREYNLLMRGSAHDVTGFKFIALSFINTW